VKIKAHPPHRQVHAGASGGGRMHGVNTVANLILD
jgi:hypothetical protein